MNPWLLGAAGLALVGFGMAALALLGGRPPIASSAGESGPSATEVHYAEEPRMTWGTVAGTDMLQVHAAPGGAGHVTAVLQGQPTGLDSTGRIALVDGVMWRELALPGDATGWVDARLLTHHTEGAAHERRHGPRRG